MTTFGDRLYQYGGMPVDSGKNPIFGKVWFVDGTNGDANNGGRKPDDAYLTIQQAITAQIANTSSLGDVIYVMPGAYAETLTGNLTKVQIIGTSCGGMTNAVSIRPTDGNAYVGDMVESAFRGIEFRTPTTSDLAYAAVAVKMDDSIIDNCSFIGTTDAVQTVGLRIGAEGATSTWEHMVNSRVSNCVTGTTGNRNYLPDHGIVFGNVSTSANAATRQFINSEIVNNRIFAHSTGIRFNTAPPNCSGGLVAGNYFHSHLGTAGVTIGIIENNADENNHCGIVNNRIICAESGIQNFGQWNLQGNIVSIAGETGVSQYGFEA